MIRKLALWLAALTLAFPLGVLALGLGNVTVNSALNEPLNAEIGLMSLKAGEVDDIKVKLGTSDAFQRAGLDRPYILSKVRFRVREDAAGGAVIKITTAQPLREPFLSFIVEVSWSTGRLLREYTLLLDPPIYGAAISAKVAGPVVVVGGEDFTTMKAPVGTGESTAVTAASTADISGSFTGDTYGPTVKSDTLWSIARRVRPNSSISIQRMMLALQQANPQAFINNNINALRAGEVLHIPDLEDIPDMSQAEALENVRDQHAQWEELRQGMAAVAGEAPAGLAGDATGEAPAVEAEEDRLEILSAGRGEVGLSDDQNTAILRKRLALNEEELNSKQAENEELGSRVMELEGLVTDLNRMIQFKNDELASLQQRLGEEGAEAETTDYVEMTEAEDVSVEEPEVAEVEEEAEAGMAEEVQAEVAEVAEEEQPEEVAVAEEPAPKPVTPPLPRPKPLLPPPPAPEPISFLDSLPVDPIILGGGLAALLLIGGGAVYMLRRRRAGVAEEIPSVAELDFGEDETVVAGDEEETEIPDKGAVAEKVTSPAEKEDVKAATVSEEEVKEDDPLAEVNVYLAYERFDQAEDLVRKAIKENPDRPEYYLKMLEIQYAAKNKEGFENDAADLRDAVGNDSPLMEQAAAWWKELSPDRELFAMLAAAEPGPQFDQTHTSLPGDTAELELDSIQADIDKGAGSSEQGEELDFDLGLTSTEDAGSEPLGNELDLDFSLEGSAEEASGDLDLDLGIDAADAVGEEVDLDFNLDMGEGETSTEEEKDEIEEKDELDLDLDFGFDLGETEAVADAEDTAEADSGLDIDLNLGMGESTAEMEGEGELDIGLDLGDEVESGDVTVDEVSMEGGLDLDLDLDESEASVEERAGEKTEDLSIDLDTGGSDAEVSATEEGTDEEEVLDLSQLFGGEQDASSSDNASVPAADVVGELELDIAAESATAETGALDIGLEVAEEDTGATPDDTEEASIDFDLDAGLEVDESAGAAETVMKEAAEEELSIDFDLDAGLEVDESAGAAETAVEAAAEEEPSIDFDLDAGLEVDETAGVAETAVEAAAEEEPSIDFDLDAGLETGDAAEPEGDTGPEIDFDLDLGLEDDEAAKTLVLGREVSGEIDEVGTKLDLAQAYVDMGDKEGARGILNEVVKEGSDVQKAEALALIDKLG